MTNKQQPRQTKYVTQTRKTVPASNLTQASSVSTPNAKSSVRMKQVPGDASNWMDWFYSYYGPDFQSGYPTQNPQYPVNPVNPQNPVNPVNPVSPQNPQKPVSSSQFEQQVLNLVNQERRKAGLQQLSMNSSLSKVAMAKAQDMYNNNYFDHQSPTYGSPFDMMKAFGISYSSAGENIAKGQNSPTEVMNQWMSSPGHRANILNSSYTQIGIAYYNGEWVQEFIG